MKLARGALVFAIGLIVGPAIAHAAIGRSVRAAVWLGGLVVVAALALVWGPLVLLLAVIWLGGALDAAILSVRTDLPVAGSFAVVTMFCAYGAVLRVLLLEGARRYPLGAVRPRRVISARCRA